MPWRIEGWSPAPTATATDSSEGEMDLAQVRPGPWRTVDASIFNGDPYGFNEYLGSGNIVYRVEQYLPSSFDVHEGQGGFYIEASPLRALLGRPFAGPTLTYSAPLRQRSSNKTC